MLALVAVLYAAVGHGGASGYLAVMALASFEPSVMKPTALTLNLIVSLVATALFFWKGHFCWKLFWPFAVVAVPFAFIGGGWQVRSEVFHWLVAGALMFAVFRLLLPGTPDRELRCPPWWAILLSASIIGLASGVIGVGGGIFLTPLLLFFGWARPATAAAVSAPFIFVNSAAGLAGHGSSVANLPSYWPLLACAVLAGGIIGARWGSAIARPVLLRRALACVLVVAIMKLVLV